MRIGLSSVVAVAALGALLSVSLVPAGAARDYQRAQEKKIRSKTIYGNDDRVDLFQVADPRLQALADSTVALFDGGSVAVDASGQKAALATQSFGAAMNLCKDEPFYDQPMGAFCSGSLVAPDVIMTAGHCIVSQDDCVAKKFVFGFSVRKAGENPSSVPAGEVYGCKELIGRLQDNAGGDFALVRLDRAASNHRPLRLNRTGRIEKGAPLVVIGHPSGLPTKVAGGAKVRDASPNGFFVANTDTYGGNSGSAVFNAETGLVEGILVRGENDFVMRGEGEAACRVSNRCPDDGCRGEDITKIGLLADSIPQTGFSLAAARVQRVNSSAFQELLKAATAK